LPSGEGIDDAGGSETAIVQDVKGAARHRLPLAHRIDDWPADDSPAQQVAVEAEDRLGGEGSERLEVVGRGPDTAIGVEEDGDIKHCRVLGESTHRIAERRDRGGEPRMERHPAQERVGLLADEGNVVLVLPDEEQVTEGGAEATEVGDHRSEERGIDDPRRERDPGQSLHLLGRDGGGHAIDNRDLPAEARPEPHGELQLDRAVRDDEVDGDPRIALPPDRDRRRVEGGFEGDARIVMLAEDDCPTRGIGPQRGEEGCVEGDEGGAIRVPEIEHEHVAIGLLGRRTGAEGQAHLSPGGPDA